MTILLGIILCYLAFLTWYGLKGGFRSESLAQFLTTGGKTGGILCALSLVSTIVGGSATLGIGGLAQKTGAAAFWWLGVGAIGLLVHGWLIAPKIRALPCVTLPEVAGYVAGKTAERWSGGIIAAAWVAVAAAQFVALHTLLQTLATPVMAECLYIMIAGAVLLHTLAGGQRAVIRTDAVQTVLLLGGFAAAACWLWHAQPEKAAALDWRLLNEHFGFLDWIKMLLLVGITYVIGPDMFSRSFSAESGRTARHAAWIAAPILVLFGAAITFVALMNVDAAQPVAGWLSENAGLPWWLRAALALGLVSALCGSADTVLLSACGIAERNLI
ncbi:Na+/solute symporter, partial [gut metagenome]